MKIIDLIGLCAGALATGSLVPQVIKTLNTKKTTDFSISYLIIFLTGICLWIIYGVGIRSAPVIVANAVTVLLVAVILYIKLVYR